jgi:hypothetical protein
MDITNTNTAAGQILEFLAKTGLKPDEKIAALETAAWTIKSVLGAEMLKLMWANVLK